MKPSTTSTTVLALLSAIAMLGSTTAARAEEKAAATESPAATTPPAEPAPAAQAAPPAEPAPAAQAAPPATAAPTPQANPAPNYGPPPGYAYPPPYGPPPGYSHPPVYGPHPGYGPPPGYGYPGYGYHPRYAPVRIVPAGQETYRPFTIGLGMGLGSIGLLNKGGWGPEMGMAYSLRLGFGITPRWLVTFAIDGAWSNFDKTSYSLSSYTAGAQFFITSALYARAGLGMGCASGEDGYGDWSDCNGQTGVAAVGFEFAQTHSTSFALEAVGGFTRFGNMFDPHKQDWRTGEVLTHVGLNLVLNLF